MQKNKILVMITLIFFVIVVLWIYIPSEPDKVASVSEPVEYKEGLDKKNSGSGRLHKTFKPLINRKKIDGSKDPVKVLLQDEIKLEQEQIDIDKIIDKLEDDDDVNKIFTNLA